MNTQARLRSRLTMASIAIGGFFATLLGGWDVTMQMLLICMAVDFATGLLVAAMGRRGKTDNGGLDSNAGAKGIAKKVILLLIVMVARCIDWVLGDGSMIRNAACWFYIGNEALSILENSALAGVPWPQKLKDALEQLKDKET